MYEETSSQLRGARKQAESSTGKWVRCGRGSARVILQSTLGRVDWTKRPPTNWSSLHSHAQHRSLTNPRERKPFCASVIVFPVKCLTRRRDVRTLLKSQKAEPCYHTQRSPTCKNGVFLYRVQWTDIPFRNHSFGLVLWLRLRLSPWSTKPKAHVFNITDRSSSQSPSRGRGSEKDHCLQLVKGHYITTVNLHKKCSGFQCNGQRMLKLLQPQTRFFQSLSLLR